MKILILIFTLLSGLIIINGCNEDNITKSGSNNIRIIDPTITITDKFGNVIGGDTTDWGNYGCEGLIFLPAFPNPTNDTVILVFEIPQYDTLSFMYLETNGDTTYLARNQYFSPGRYNYSVSATEHLLHGRVVRFLAASKLYPSGTLYCRYYGDIQFY